ncbi:MAG: type IV pilus assembly protein PilM, partial [Bacteroidales bacterium]|nr:type IV pilus assembly protein PilM [Bacteroidales bacterium]
MAKPIGVWGIDIGQCALKAVRLEIIDGLPTATAFDYIEHQKILSQPDADPDALTREALEKFLERNPVKKDQIAVGIPGQSGLARFVKLPPVEEKKIPEIVKFEAKQQIPFPLEDVVWDYQKIAGGEVIGGFAMETEVGLFAMKRDVIARFMSHFQAVKADVHFVQMASLALCNFATYEVLKKGGPDGVEGDGIPLAEGETDDTPRGKRRCAVVLDVGTDNSNLIITDGGKIIWQRPLPLGGNNFTRALTKEMKLTFAKAEHLKRNAAKSPELATILKALRPVLNEFVSEVQRSLGYFTNTHRDAHVAFMVGLGNAFRLPGLQKYMAEKLSLDVRKPANLDRFYGDAVLNDLNFKENVLTFPVALGLALQGIGLARLQTNLLPDEIRVDRMIRAKKPWAAAAAACLLLGTGALAFGYGSNFAAVSDSEIEKTLTQSKSVVDQAKQQDSEKSSKKSTVDTTASEVKTIIAGNDERLNWIRLNEVLVAALPRHGDGGMNGNLIEEHQLPFWSTEEGRLAYNKYRQRMKEGIPLEKLFDDDLSQHLANINLESVDARYTTDLATFLNNADAYVVKKYGLDIAEDLAEGEREQDQTTNPPRYKPKP